MEGCGKTGIEKSVSHNRLLCSTHRETGTPNNIFILERFSLPKRKLESLVCQPLLDCSKLIERCFSDVNEGVDILDGAIESVAFSSATPMAGKSVARY